MGEVSVRGRACIAMKMCSLEVLAKDSGREKIPMLCLSDSIRHDDPAVQQSSSTMEAAQTLTQLI